MEYVIACLTAACSYVLNRALLKALGTQVIITISPVIEEMLKTLLPFYLDANILTTHVVFGVIEAVYDMVQSQEHGITAAVLSVAGHGLFGALTVYAMQTAGIYIGLASGIIAHLLWNSLMIRLHRENNRN